MKKLQKSKCVSAFGMEMLSEKFYSIFFTVYLLFVLFCLPFGKNGKFENGRNCPMCSIQANQSNLGRLYSAQSKIVWKDLRKEISQKLHHDLLW